MALFVAVSGVALTLMHRPAPSTLSSGQRNELVGRVETTPRTKGRWHQAQVRVTHRLDSVDGWRAIAPYRTLLYVDTSQSVGLGQTISFRARGYAIDSSYGDYMGRRGIYSRSYTWRLSHLGADTTALERIALLQGDLADRLSRGVGSFADHDAAAVMQALALGYRTEMDRQMRGEYSRVGVAHILAVSGMHVGIIFIVLNMLLGWLRIFRRGQVWLGCCVILILIFYALITGLSPSVLRAVVMFSLVQVGLMISRPTTMLNTLCAAAIGLLVWNPLWLYDIGFQLSFAAMVGIATLYGPMAGLLRTRNVVVGWLWRITVVALAAQVCTLPLATHYFGVLPLIGLLINPVVWFTVPVIMIGSWLYLFSGWGWVVYMTSAVARFQNHLVEYSASHGWIAVEGVRLSAAWTWAIYVLLIVIIVTLNNRSVTKKINFAEVKT